MRAYYNEIDANAAAWLRNLIAAGAIPEGDVDERSIVDVRPGDVAGYGQCHFFAGIGGWPLILALAGWPPERPVWTGSCPCQPFSIAGRRAGTADARHLWPEFGRLIGECGPPAVFGEQVASAAGLEWFAVVRADLERCGYACGAADLPAACVGAPHIRQRLWWTAKRLGLADGERREQVVAALARRQQLPDGRGGAGGLGDPGGDGPQGRLRGRPDPRRQVIDGSAGRDGATGGLADAVRGGAGDGTREGMGAQAAPDGGDGRLQGQRLRAGVEGPPGGLADAVGDGRDQQPGERGVEGGARVGRHQPDDGGGVGRLADAGSVGWRSEGQLDGPGAARPDAAHGAGAPHPGWGDADWLLCRDGKWRPVEPGTFPLAHGVPGRVGRLRAYGNAVVPQVGAAFVRAVMGEEIDA